MKKLFIFGSVAVAAIIIALGVILAMPRAAIAPKPSPTATTGTFSGRVVCLRHKNPDGPQTTECAMGLETDDGRQYGIKNDTGVFYDTSERLTVKGSLAAPEASEAYGVAGNITATEITKQPAR